MSKKIVKVKPEKALSLEERLVKLQGQMSSTDKALFDLYKRFETQTISNENLTAKTLELIGSKIVEHTNAINNIQNGNIMLTAKFDGTVSDTHSKVYLYGKSLALTRAMLASFVASTWIVFGALKGSAFIGVMGIIAALIAYYATDPKFIR